MPCRRLLLLCLFSMAGFLFLFSAKPAFAVVTPPGFTDTLVTDVGAPTALAFTSDGRMLIATQPGKLRVHKDGVLLTDPALDLTGRICSNSERGLLGVAVDPDFASNGYIYAYYTYKKHGVCEQNTSKSPVNRVSRFTASGDTVDPASEVVLVDNIPSPNGNHNAGDVHFGKDGYLYASVGDGGCDYAEPTRCQGNNDASRDRHVLLGKVLRITRDGGIPPGNPYTGSGSARCNLAGRTDPGKDCQETFARGLRNPFRMAFDPNAADTSFRINDVGSHAWEEIDRGQPGADYGWNLCEGAHDNPDRSGSVDCTAVPYTPPVHEYNHGTGCSSITGGVFVPDGVWPLEYDGSYLFGDYVCGKIFKLTPKSGGGFTRTDFVTGLGDRSAVTMAFGPHGSGQALYYTTYAGGGEVRRLVHAGAANDVPTATATATPTYGDLPLEVSFDGAASSDPDDDDLTYEWDFGDGTPIAAGSTANHTYTEKGPFTATLTVRDRRGGEDTATVRVYPGNTPPEPAIASPTPETLFRVGQKITLSGGANDAEDSTVADSSLSWRVLLHHGDDHTHPLLGPISGSRVEFTAPTPEDLPAAPNSYLEIQLTATDSQGLSRTISQELRPKLVNLTFETAPVGLKIRVNGAAVRAPRTLVSWEGYKLNVEAFRQKDRAGRVWVFKSWSDGRGAEHRIMTPGSDTTYTARFARLR